jgi:hypothetical protein
MASMEVLAGPFNPYDWEKTRSRFNLTAAEQDLSELVLKSHVEFNYGFENDQFLMQSVLHQIVIVNGSQAIQKHNRIFVPMNGVIELTELKARAITKDGKVVYFDKNNLKEVKDEESDNSYRLFAIEGIESGSEIEYFFVRKMYPRFYERSSIQKEIPIRRASFMLTSGHTLDSHLQLW